MMEPWDRQKEESAQAYEAFCRYRDMGSSRSIAKVAQELSKSQALLNRWSGRWQWVWRCVQYDAFIDHQQQERRRREILDARDRHANLAKLMQGKFLEKMQSLSPQDIPPMVLVQMVKVATDIELRSLGVATETIRAEHTGADGGPVQTDLKVILDALNDSDTREALDALSARLESQSSGDSG